MELKELSAGKSFALLSEIQTCSGESIRIFQKVGNYPLAAVEAPPGRILATSEGMVWAFSAEARVVPCAL